MNSKQAADVLSLDDQIVIALRRISQAIDVWSSYLWHDYGLTSPQLATLHEILAGKNVSPVALATALSLSQPTVTGILGRLERRGLIRRERSSKDRRSVLSSVTEQGRELAAKAPPLLRDHFRYELAKLQPEQQLEILAILQRVATMMHAPEIVDGPFFFHEQKGPSRATKGHSYRQRRKDVRNEAKPPAPVDS